MKEMDDLILQEQEIFVIMNFSEEQNTHVLYAVIKIFKKSKVNVREEYDIKDLSQKKIVYYKMSLIHKKSFVVNIRKNFKNLRC